MGRIRTLYSLIRNVPPKVLLLKSGLFSKPSPNIPLKDNAGELLNGDLSSSCKGDSAHFLWGFSGSDFRKDFAAELNREREGFILKRAHGAVGHVFDLLGSGAVKVGYEDLMVDSAVKDKMEVFCRNMGLFDGDYGCYLKEQFRLYRPIDWHIDFKSGYRWDIDDNDKSITSPFLKRKNTIPPGADIKVPWELSRFHHGLHLALATLLKGEGESEKDDFGAEFVLEVLDWSAANPVGKGVNWSCTMDVAIRAVNWIWALAFLREHPAVTPGFQGFLKERLYEHGLFIAGNLEFLKRGYNSNHYLANLAGLIYIAGAYPSFDESSHWLSFALKELIQEMDYQVYDDGVSYESSTAYHRLVTEIFLSCTAAALSLHKRFKKRLQNDSAFGHFFDSDLLFPERFFNKLYKMVLFTESMMKDDGTLPRFGDDDSGRLHPFISDGSNNHRHILASAGFLFENRRWQDKGKDFSGEGFITGKIAKGARYGLKIFNANESMENFYSRPDLNGVPKNLHLPKFKDRKEGIDGKKLFSFINLGKTSLRSVFTVEIDKATAGGGFDSEKVNGYDPVNEAGFAVFTQGGYYVNRCSGYYAAISCSLNGMGGLGAHAHNDKLSFELRVAGRDFIVDGGSYLYSSNPALRNDFRSTVAHNTLVVNGLEQNEILPGYLFTLPEKSFAKITGADRNYFSGLHRGYGFEHRREFFFEEERIIVTDYLAKKVPCFMVFNLHSHVNVERLDNSSLILRNSHSAVVLRFETLKGFKVDSGFFAEKYGRRIENKRIILPVSF